ncbi:MAG: YggU family protein [Leptonema sp. (in: Bacteria)]|nr:YggU family protein [Leptonema sp. (in: bacteria)]
MVQRYSIYVKPKSSKRSVVELTDGSLEVKVHSPPEDGKANIEVIEVLAKYFKVKKRHLSIVTGSTSRHKIVELSYE